MCALTTSPDYAATVRTVRDVAWTVFLAVTAAEIVAVIVPLPLGVALVAALGLLALCLTVVDGIRSGNIAFLVAVARYKLHAHTPGLRGSLGAVLLDGGSLSEHALMFTTNADQRRVVKTDRAPIGISFVTPVEQEISSSQVPCRVKKAGLTILRLDRFIDHGIVISKQLPGIEIRAEVSYVAEGTPVGVADRATATGKDDS
jgi:hypothetical protein